MFVLLRFLITYYVNNISIIHIIANLLLYVIIINFGKCWIQTQWFFNAPFSFNYQYMIGKEITLKHHSRLEPIFLW